MQVEIIKFIQSYRTPLLDKLFEFITIIGEETLIILIAAYIFFNISKEKGYAIIFAIVSSTSFNSLLKNIFKVSRPIGIEGIKSKRLKTATSYSFPSGHTQTVSSLWTSLMIIFKKKFLYIIGSILICLVAFSRIYLGVHWPLDVIFGAIIGILWSFASIRVFKFIYKNKKYKLLILIVGIFTLLSFLFGDKDFYKTSGLFLGISIAYIIEDKYINFSLDIPNKLKVTIYIITLLGIFIIKEGLKYIFPSLLIFDFIRYALIGFWALCGGIYTGKKIGKNI